MTSIKAFGELLTASEDTRTLTYRLLPFGEPGRTSAGTVTVSSGAITLPEDVTTLVANMEHDRTRPVARFISVDEAEDGLNATVRVSSTTAGNDLLIEAADRLRTGISVEIDSPVIRNGALLGGTLSGAGFVHQPAFDSARLVAADAGDLPESLEINGSTYSRQEEPDTEDEPNNAADESAADKEDEMEETSVTSAAAAAPAGLHASAFAVKKAAPKTIEEFADSLSAAYRKGGQPAMTAALVDIVHDDGDNDGDGLGEITSQGEWLGNVWEDAPYTRLYIPLIQGGALTSFNASGYRFTSKPKVAKYTGNKTAVPSTGMTAERVSYDLERWANAADIDRRYVDFSDSEVIAAFLRANVESYKEETDKETLRNIIASAEVVTPGTVPAGIDASVGAIADASVSLLASGLKPTAAVVGLDLYRELLLTPKDKISEFLNESVSLSGGGSISGFRIVPSAEPEAEGLVTVVDGRTLQLKEFGGSTPVRVQAENVAQGGVDIAVFGYTSFRVLRDGGVKTVELGASA